MYRHIASVQHSQYWAARGIPRLKVQVFNITVLGQVSSVVRIDLVRAVAMAAEPEPEVTSCDVLKAWQKSEVVMRRLNHAMLVHLPSDAKKTKREHLGENVDLLAPILEHLGSSVDPLLLPPQKCHAMPRTPSPLSQTCAQASALPCTCWRSISGGCTWRAGLCISECLQAIWFKIGRSTSWSCFPIDHYRIPEVMRYRPKRGWHGD